MGLTGYYWCFMLNFASIAIPFLDLNRKSELERVCWAITAECTFQTLKDTLTSSPVLQNPDFQWPFLVQINTSIPQSSAVTGVGWGKASGSLHQL